MSFARIAAFTSSAFMPLLEIRNVTRRFGDFTAVNDVSLSIEAGEFFTLLGPSGGTVKFARCVM